jgi:hypothetical protein
MTNGEKLEQVFPDGICPFFKSWLDCEYKEPLTKINQDLTKNDDCISREQALKELKESAEHHANDSREEVLLRRDRDIIRALPSVTPQEPILDKIRAEIDKIYEREGNSFDCLNALDELKEFIDKYKGESEIKNGNDD